MSEENGKVCCNCRHNLRIPYKDSPMISHNECEIDGHRIGYVECFEGWCRHWARETKWDKVE